jgi:hypothetical protein
MAFLADRAEAATRVFATRLTDDWLTRSDETLAERNKVLISLEATPGIEPGYTVLQTVA